MYRRWTRSHIYLFRWAHKRKWEAKRETTNTIHNWLQYQIRESIFSIRHVVELLFSFIHSSSSSICVPLEEKARWAQLDNKESTSYEISFDFFSFLFISFLFVCASISTIQNTRWCIVYIGTNAAKGKHLPIACSDWMPPLKSLFMNAVCIFNLRQCDSMPKPMKIFKLSFLGRPSTLESSLSKSIAYFHFILPNECLCARLCVCANIRDESDLFSFFYYSTISTGLFRLFMSSLSLSLFFSICH